MVNIVQVISPEGYWGIITKYDAASDGSPGTIEGEIEEDPSTGEIEIVFDEDIDREDSGEGGKSFRSEEVWLPSILLSFLVIARL